MNEGQELSPKPNQELKSALGRAINNLELSMKKAKDPEWFDKPEPIQNPNQSNSSTENPNEFPNSK